MIYIGNHLTSSKGFLAMGQAESELGGNTFAFFTRNPRGGKAKEIDENDAKNLVNYLKENNFGKLVAHGSYTMNLCSDKPDIREFAKNTLIDDLKRMEYIPNQYYNFHPGSHVSQGAEFGINIISDVLNDVLFDDMTTTVLLETMAGKGTEIGRTFEELKSIISNIRDQKHIGVCLDTCHVWDGGYDLSSFDKILDDFDRVIGIRYLKAIHLNDSQNLCGAHKDRHEKIGLGKIGSERLKSVVRNPVLQGMPFILETPNDDDGYKYEISLIKSWMI